MVEIRGGIAIGILKRKKRTEEWRERIKDKQPGKGKKVKGRGQGRGGKKGKKPEVDILNPATMLNLYYIAHNVADCLQYRGFRWPGAAKKKKGKKI